jgi:hypothetical protein
MQSNKRRPVRRECRGPRRAARSCDTSRSSPGDEIESQSAGILEGQSWAQSCSCPSTYFVPERSSLAFFPFMNALQRLGQHRDKLRFEQLGK